MTPQYISVLVRKRRGEEGGKGKGWGRDRRKKKKRRKKSRTTENWLYTHMKESITRVIIITQLYKNNVWRNVASNYAVVFKRFYCWGSWFTDALLMKKQKRETFSLEPMYVVKFLWTNSEVCGSIPDFP